MKEIKYCFIGLNAWNHDTPDIKIMEVAVGVYFIEVDFHSRNIDVIGYGGDGNIFNEGLIVEDIEDYSGIDDALPVMNILFSFPSEGFVFGNINKSTWRGTFYTHKAHEALHEENHIGEYIPEQNIKI